MLPPCFIPCRTFLPLFSPIDRPLVSCGAKTGKRPPGYTAEETDDAQVGLHGAVRRVEAGSPRLLLKNGNETVGVRSCSELISAMPYKTVHEGPMHLKREPVTRTLQRDGSASSPVATVDRVMKR